MSWFDVFGVSLIVGWACLFLGRRWWARQQSAPACGHCDNQQCGKS